MTQVLIKNIPSTFSDLELNFNNKLDLENREALIEVIEYLEDYLYVSDRWKKEENIEYVWKKNVLDLISEYK